MSSIRFEVRGIPVPQGSMRAFMPKGARFPVVTHGNPKVMDWRRLVATEAQRVAPASPWTGPVNMVCLFYLQRPKSHYRANGLLKESAPKYPIGKPDAGKLARNVEDALTGIIYRDDAQIVSALAAKDYGERPGVYVELWPTEPAQPWEVDA